MNATTVDLLKKFEIQLPHWLDQCPLEESDHSSQANPDNNQDNNLILPCL